MKDIGQGWHLEGFLLAIQGLQCHDVDLSQRKVNIAFQLLVLVINPGREPYLCLNRGDGITLEDRVAKPWFLMLRSRVTVPVFSITVTV